MPSYYSKRVFAPAEQIALELVSNHFGNSEAENPKLVALRSIVPFHQFAISGLNYKGLGFGKGIFLASDIPESLLRQFHDKVLFARDPLHLRLSPEHPWASWHDLNNEELTSSAAVELKALFETYGLKPRTTIAFYKDGKPYGGATFTRDTPFSPTELFILEAGARLIHAELSETCIKAMSLHAGLSHGELACLQKIADGKNADTIAQETGYALETVSSYIKHVSHKLGAMNRTHAVAEALRRKIIR